jgi:hypothetical protein
VSRRCQKEQHAMSVTSNCAKIKCASALVVAFETNARFMKGKMKLALVLVVMLLAAFPALASPNCMTKHEARARYPTTWLYWHTERHCWDATAGHRSRSVKLAKKSAREFRTFHPSGEVLPNREAAATRADAISIWPDPPSVFTWSDRWPDQQRILPQRWLLELQQFGRAQ